MEGRSDAADGRAQENGRNPFEKFLDAVNHRQSRGPFFGIIVLAIVLWEASFPLWKTTSKGAVAAHRDVDPVAAAAGAPRERALS